MFSCIQLIIIKLRIIKMIRGKLLLRPGFSFFKDFFSKFQNPGQDNKKHPLDEFLLRFASNSNISTPPLDKTTALRILNIQEQESALEPNTILQRFITLYKKNDPSIGGTIYLQSKVLSAKNQLMSQFPDFKELEKRFTEETGEVIPSFNDGEERLMMQSQINLKKQKKQGKQQKQAKEQQKTEGQKQKVENIEKGKGQKKKVRKLHKKQLWQEIQKMNSQEIFFMADDEKQGESQIQKKQPGEDQKVEQNQNKEEEKEQKK